MLESMVDQRDFSNRSGRPYIAMAAQHLRFIMGDESVSEDMRARLMSRVAPFLVQRDAYTSASARDFLAM
jgi:hypothetical protein